MCRWRDTRDEKVPRAPKNGSSRGVEKVREAVVKGPVIFLPTHRSYIDFLIISYITFANNSNWQLLDKVG